MDSDENDTAVLSEVQARSLAETLVRQRGRSPETDETITPLAIDAAGGAAAGARQPAPDAGPGTVDPIQLPLLALDEADLPLPSADLHVTELLAEGGMGVIHLARQDSLQREVAIKRAKPSAGTRGTTSVLHEAVISGYLEHPNIVPVHALGRDRDDQPVMVMQRIDGVAWRELCRDPDHPRWQTVRGDRLQFHLGVFLQLCHAVAFAHSRHIIHRDIKPANVMIGQFGEVYLLDWGIGYRRGAPPPTEPIGTPSYMAPEMCAPGSAPIDARTDVYLLGATLHEALVGTPRHHKPTLMAVFVAAARSERFDYPPEVPAELGAICNRATARDPDYRYQSAGELRDAVQDFIAHRASNDLASVAEQLLAELQRRLGDASQDRRDSSLEGRLSECRFGFEQALARWPQNPRARQGRQALLQLVVRHAVAERQLTRAEDVLALLDDAPDELAQAVAKLRTELAADAAERQRLERLAHESDLSVGADPRRRATLIAVAISGVFIVTNLTLIAVGVLRLTLALVLAATAIGSVLGATIIFLSRRELFANRVSRQFVAIIALTLGAVLLHRAQGLMLGERFRTVLAADLLIVALGAACAGLTLRRLYLIPALLFGTAAVMATVVPRLALLWAIVVIPFAVASVLLGARIERRLGWDARDA